MAELPYEQMAAYQECRAMALANRWLASYNAITDAGPGGVDWVAMAKKWRKDDKLAELKQREGE